MTFLRARRPAYCGRCHDACDRAAHSLAGLRRAQTPLRALGIEIVFGREGRLGTRTIRITAMGENRTHDTVSTVSRVSDHGDRAGLNHPPPGLEQAL